MKAKMDGQGKSSRVRVPKDLSVCCYFEVDNNYVFISSNST